MDLQDPAGGRAEEGENVFRAFRSFERTVRLDPLF
jgi:hypothetical protein